jgi:hypothetical protein
VTSLARFRSAFLPPVLLLPALAGCHTRAASSAQAKAEQRAQVAQERQELGQIPPPSKSRYMSVRSMDSWQNPSITVQPDMFTVHILMADANTSPVGAGGMLRPVGARRQEVSIHFDKLGDAMSAIPATAWPYGRVVAVEEAHHTPKQQEPVMRRNMEAAVATLNDLGIMAYDLTDGNLR